MNRTMAAAVLLTPTLALAELSDAFHGPFEAASTFLAWTFIVFLVLFVLALVGLVSLARGAASVSKAVIRTAITWKPNESNDPGRSTGAAVELPVVHQEP